MQAVFFVSTGRCGTTFLSESIKRSATLVVHEWEEPSAQQIMNQLYIPLAKSGDHNLGQRIVKEYKIPHLQKILATSGQTDFIDTGHQYNFGLLPHLLDKFPNTKLVRLRRDRFETALSFMTTDEKYDIWNAKEGSAYYRWMLSPHFKICNTPAGIIYEWEKLSRFQKVLWAVDEVERQWQSLLKVHEFEFLEYDFNQIKLNNFAILESFLDAKVVVKEGNQAKNSSEYRGRVKPSIPLEQMLNEDGELQQLYTQYY